MSHALGCSVGVYRCVQIVMTDKLAKVEALLDNIVQRAKQDRRLGELLTAAEIDSVEYAADLLPMIRTLLSKARPDKPAVVESDLSRGECHDSNILECATITSEREQRPSTRDDWRYMSELAAIKTSPAVHFRLPFEETRPVKPTDIRIEARDGKCPELTLVHSLEDTGQRFGIKEPKCSAMSSEPAPQEPMARSGERRPRAGTRSSKHVRKSSVSLVKRLAALNGKEAS